jgi:hypothetical protein
MYLRFQVSEASNRDAVEHLARRLVERSDLAGFERRTDTGDEDAARRLALLLAEQAYQARLERRAARGDEDAAWQLASRLAERGDQAGLERRADTGDRKAARLLTEFLIERGDLAGWSIGPMMMATGGRRGGWLRCWSSTVTWPGYSAGPMLARSTPRSSLAGCKPGGSDRAA